jgi:tetratricopeptide (TPR) repeat protein
MSIDLPQLSRLTPRLLPFFAALFAATGSAQVPGVSREEMWPAPTAEDWAKPCLITWQRCWEDALEVSRLTGKPLMIAVNMDGEIASEHWAGIRYREEDTAKLYEPYVCVIASVYRHNPRDYAEDGSRILCPRFGSVTCGEHIRIEPQLYDQYFDGKRIAPRHIGVELDQAEVYDVYYAFDIDSVKTAVYSGIADRPDTRLPDTRGDRSDVELVASPDVIDRTAVEQAYASGSYEKRREILAAAAKVKDLDQVDLLRRALFGGDPELSQLAFGILAETNTESAVDLIADVLRYPLGEEEKQPLLAALDRLGETWPRARDIATVHRGLGVESKAIDLGEWKSASSGPVGSGSYAGQVELQARLEATAEIAQGEPQDPEAQLDIAASFLALAVRPEASPRRARVLFDDALIAARKAEDLGASGWRVDSLIGLATYYMGRRGESHTRIERAVTELPVGAEDWNSMAVLSLFADTRQQQIRRAARKREHWPAEWLSDLHAAHEVLERHPFGSDQHMLSHYDFLRDLGAGAQASEVLDRGLERFPDSWGLHDRLRARALEQEQLGGLGGLEATYEAMLVREDASPTLPWFAGYASFVAAEFHRRSGEETAADDAYGRAIAHYETAIAQVPDCSASADHYIALAIAARARLALERGEFEKAQGLILQSFARNPAAAGAVDGLNLTPVMTATTLIARLEEAKRPDLAEALRVAISELPAEAREAPVFEQESRGSGPSPDARRFRERQRAEGR